MNQCQPLRHPSDWRQSRWVTYALAALCIALGWTHGWLKDRSTAVAVPLIVTAIALIAAYWSVRSPRSRAFKQAMFLDVLFHLMLLIELWFPGVAFVFVAMCFLITFPLGFVILYLSFQDENARES